MIEASSDSHEGSAITPDDTEAVNAEGTSDVNNVIAHGAFRIGSWVISNGFVTLPVSAEVRCDVQREAEPRYATCSASAGIRVAAQWQVLDPQLQR